MKLKQFLYWVSMFTLAVGLSGCVPLLIGASAGAVGGYVYSKNAPNTAGQ